MAIVKMNKFTLLAFESKKEALLEKLQEFSNAEFINLQDENLLEQNEILSELKKDIIDSDIAKWEEQLSKVKFALQFLKDYVPKQSLVKTLRTEKLSLTMDELKEKVESSNWESVYEKVKEKEEGIARLDNDKTKLQTAVSSLTPYEAFDAPLSFLKELKETSYFLGSVANQYEESLISELNDCYVEIISKTNQDTYFIALCNKANKDSVEEALRGFGFTPFKTDEEETPLKLIHEYNDRIGLIILGEDYYLNFEDVKDEEIDDVPIKLENNDLNDSFMSITEMYALPKYDEIDPTPIVTPFYLVFFGMMVADMGYGLLMLIGTIIALKYLKFDDGMKKMIKFFHYLSYPTIAFGAIYGSFFGDLIPLPKLIDTTADVMTILVLSVVFGAIQIFFALGVKAYVLIRAGKPLEAFMDAGSWAITLISLGLLAGGMMGNIPMLGTIGKIGAIAGSVLIVITQGRWKGSFRTI